MQSNPSDSITFLEYNSQRPKLIIPEYGRHLQKLIDIAVETKDINQRNKLAKYIISVMGSLQPHLRDVPDFQHKLWDQLFIMSDFRLEVNSPFPIPSRELLSLKPERLAYPQNFPKYRFYGNNIIYMINQANKWEESDKKNILIRVIANHMKKSYLSWNKDSVKDEVIFKHLYELSKGKIDLLKENQELSNSSDLMKINKKISNKTNLNNNNNKNQFQKQKNGKNKAKNNN